jgi:hypothetical protein
MQVTPSELLSIYCTHSVRVVLWAHSTATGSTLLLAVPAATAGIVAAAGVSTTGPLLLGSGSEAAYFNSMLLNPATAGTASSGRAALATAAGEDLHK